MNPLKILLLVSTLMLAACVHKPTIEQGNIVTKEQISQLHKGMSEEQVRALLGSPVMEEPFNRNRLEYVYTLKQGRHASQAMRLTLLFKDNKLVRIDDEESFTLSD